MMKQYKQFQAGTAVLLLLWLILLLSGCGGRDRGRLGQMAPVPGGNPNRGQLAVQEHGCTSCHRIPGVARAGSLVGPPLDAWADRGYIAGRLPNTPENLIHFIQFPQAVAPGIIMPDMDISDDDARDIAAYLYTLRRGRWFER